MAAYRSKPVIRQKHSDVVFEPIPEVVLCLRQQTHQRTPQNCWPRRREKRDKFRPAAARMSVARPELPTTWTDVVRNSDG